MAAPPYSTVGPYKHGVWLVVLKNGATAIMDRQNLPGYKPGTRYYWLGTTPDEAASRIWGALDHMGLDVSTVPQASAIAPAFRGKIVGVSGDWGTPGGPSQTVGVGGNIPNPTYPGAGYGAGGAGGPLGFMSGISGAITSIEDFLSFIAWIFHPLNILRTVEFLAGGATMIYGLNVLMHGARRSAMTHRTTVGSIWRETIGGRITAGRRGRAQGRRDVAYRQARIAARSGNDNSDNSDSE